jgi:hypothetical protein
MDKYKVKLNRREKDDPILFTMFVHTEKEVRANPFYKRVYRFSYGVRFPRVSLLKEPAKSYESRICGFFV